VDSVSGNVIDDVSEGLDNSNYLVHCSKSKQLQLECINVLKQFYSNLIMDAFEGMVNVVAKVITSYLIIIVFLSVGQLLWNP